MTVSSTHLAIGSEWLANTDEPVFDPTQPVIDSHHHLYERPGLRYLMDDYLADVAGGHNVRASIFIQARAALRSDGPAEMRPVGETEFASSLAALSANRATKICAGIVGFADLTIGERVRAVLKEHIASGGGRFCGIRHILCWDKDSSLLNPAYPTSENMIDGSGFRAGFSQLSKLGLSFDVWALFPQLNHVARLAAAFPDTRIVIDHCGGVVRINDYARRSDTFDSWKQGIAALAVHENVSIKLSGLGMRQCGFGFENLPQAPDSEVLARAWRPWVVTCLEKFGARRCMWGSNFPVDKGSYAFKIGLNAFQRLVSDASADEKDDVFWRTAKTFYRLP